MRIEAEQFWRSNPPRDCFVAPRKDTIARSVSGPFPYNRICIVGTSATGKSTLARELAKSIGGDHIELDSLYHEPNWQPASWETFIARARDRMSAERWVIDGNYANRAGQFEAADLIIWLDYPFRIVLWRVLRRTIKRLLTKEELWNGNRESWRMAFSKESIILWVFQTYWKRRKEFSLVLSSPALAHVRVMRLGHPRETREMVRGMVGGEGDWRINA